MVSSSPRGCINNQDTEVACFLLIYDYLNASTVTVQTIPSKLESAGENRDIVESYKAGQAALAVSLEQNSIDDVLDLMDNLKELSE